MIVRYSNVVNIRYLYRFVCLDVCQRSVMLSSNVLRASVRLKH